VLKNKWIYLIIVVVAIAALVGVGAWLINSGSKDYVATVGNEKITTAEYQVFLHDVEKQIESYANVGTDATALKDFWAGKLGDQQAETVAKNAALENAKDFMTRLMKANELKLVIDTAALDKLNSDLDKQLASYGIASAQEKAIQATYGCSVKDYKAFVKDFYLAREVLTTNQKKKIVNTEAEIKKYYDTNKSALEEVTVRHILFSINDATTGAALTKTQQAAVKKTATSVMNQIKAGADMAALAKKYSSDTGSKDNGGLLAPFVRGQMVKAFEDWSFKAKVGDIGLVTSTYGYHVVRLEGKKTSYKDLKAATITALTTKKYDDIVATWRKALVFVTNQKVFDAIKVNT